MRVFEGHHKHVALLGTLAPGEVFRNGDPGDVFIRTSEVGGTFVSCVRLSDGMLIHLSPDNKVILLPCAALVLHHD